MRKRPMIELVACDVDGTLLCGETFIHDINFEALKKARAKNVKIVLASGRTKALLSPVLKRLGQPVYLVTGNGAALFDDKGKPIAVRTLESRDIHEAMDICLDNDGAVFVQTNEKSFYTARDGDMKKLMAHIAKGVAESPIFSEHISEEQMRAMAQGGEIIKMMLLNRVPEKMEKMAEELACLEGRVFMVRSNRNNIEVMPKGCSKGSGLETMAALLEVPLENTMAIGNEGNDVAMFDAAGLAVAVEDASDAALAAADVQTQSAEAGGAGRAILRYALGTEA